MDSIGGGQGPGELIADLEGVLGWRDTILRGHVAGRYAQGHRWIVHRVSMPEWQFPDGVTTPE